MGHLDATFGDKLRTRPGHHSPRASEEGFAISLKSPNQHPPPGMCCAAKMYLCSHFFLQCGFAAMRATGGNKSPWPEIKLHLCASFWNSVCAWKYLFPLLPVFHFITQPLTSPLSYVYSVHDSVQLILVSLVMDLSCLFNTEGLVPYYLSGFLDIFSGCHSLQLAWPRLLEIPNWSVKMLYFIQIKSPLWDCMVYLKN